MKGPACLQGLATQNGPAQTGIWELTFVNTEANNTCVVKFTIASHQASSQDWAASSLRPLIDVWQLHAQLVGGLILGKDKKDLVHCSPSSKYKSYPGESS